MRLLVVEDDPALRAGLAEALAGAGHAVDAAADGASGGLHLREREYDLVLLDLGLPGADGLALCREARARGLATPILLLTARDAVADRVAGLDAGADDYLVKPFDLDELLARVRALLRRRTERKAGVLTVGDLVLDPATGDVTRGGRPVPLSRKQRSLLEYMMRHAGEPLSRERLLAHVWDSPERPGSDVVRAQVKLLRRALGDDGALGLIRTVHGVGYRLDEP